MDGPHGRHAASELLTWLQAEGASVNPSVRLERCPEKGGVGLFATGPLPPGAHIFSVSCRHVLSGPAALACDGIGEALRSLKLTDQQLVVLLLLYARQRGSSSPYNSYVCTLPTEHDFSELLPHLWPEAQQLELLGGTPLMLQTQRQQDALLSFHKDIIERVLLVEWAHVFSPPEAYSLERLSWAAAVWSSRAIRLELPGGARECLVPLLDMMNHTPGLSTRVTLERPSRDRAEYAVRLERRVGAGEELFLNYGAKGNGELLRCHGFVLDHNPCDLFELDLSPLDVHERHARLKMRHHLFRGGLPPLLLPEARVLCASDGAELAEALAALDTRGGADGTRRGGDAAGADIAMDDGQPPPQGDETTTGSFDWSLVDWSADDPFAKANAALEGATPPAAPAGAACEKRALGGITALLREHLAALPAPQGPGDAAYTPLPSADCVGDAAAAFSDSSSGGGGGGRAAAAAAAAREGASHAGDAGDASASAESARRRDAARIYVAGLREILHEALEALDRTDARLAPPGGGTDDGVASEAARARPAKRRRDA